MPKAWTYIIDEPRRTELLKEMGVSEKVIALGNEAPIDPVFDFYCKKPKHKFKGDDTPGPELVVAIFESQYDESFAVRKKDGTAEFVYINTRNPDDLTVYGDSAQSILRGLFDQIVDSEYNKRSDIERAAEIVGFECLADTYAFIFAEREQMMQGQRQMDMKAYHKRRLDYVRGIYKPGTDNPGV